MLVAVKGNRETKISADEKQAYIDNGHKVIEVSDNKQKVLHDPSKVGKVDAKGLKALEAKVSKLENEMVEKNALITKLEADLVAKDAQIEDIRAELKKVTK